MTGLYQPTDADPGSEEKLQVMIARHEAGLPCFHDDDRREHHSDFGAGVFASEDQERRYATGTTPGRVSRYVRSSPGAPRVLKWQRGESDDE